jgi:hypothetical protein
MLGESLSPSVAMLALGVRKMLPDQLRRSRSSPAGLFGHVVEGWLPKRESLASIEEHSTAARVWLGAASGGTVIFTLSASMLADGRFCVERTFAWLFIASTKLLSRRLARAQIN